MFEMSASHGQSFFGQKSHAMLIWGRNLGEKYAQGHALSASELTCGSEIQQTGFCTTPLTALAYFLVLAKGSLVPRLSGDRAAVDLTPIDFAYSKYRFTIFLPHHTAHFFRSTHPLLDISLLASGKLDLGYACSSRSCRYAYRPNFPTESHLARPPHAIQLSARWRKQLVALKPHQPSSSCLLVMEELARYVQLCVILCTPHDLHRRSDRR